jgi:uncharacterized protein (DUF1697 family)
MEKSEVAVAETPDEILAATQASDLAELLQFEEPVKALPAEKPEAEVVESKVEELPQGAKDEPIKVEEVPDEVAGVDKEADVVENEGEVKDKPAEVDEVSLLRAQIEALNAQLSKFTDEQDDDESAESTHEDEVVSKIEKVLTERFGLQKQQQVMEGVKKELALITPENWEDTITPQGLNAVLNTAIQAAVQQSLQQNASIIDARADAALERREFNREFYRANSDLKPYTVTVQKVCKKLIASKPDMTMQELFVAAADRSREELRLKKPEQKVLAKEAAENPRKPGFTKAQSTRGLPSGKPQGKSIIDEIKGLML